MFTTRRLGNLLELRVLELSEFAGVLEHLDEAVLVEGFLGCLDDGADGLASGLKEALLVQIGRVDVGHLGCLGILWLGLSLVHWGILDSDGLTHLYLVNDDGFIGAKDVERDLVFTIALN